MAVWPFFQNETIPPCIMLKQTNDPCPGLTVRFPSPYTFSYGNRCITAAPRPAPVIKSKADQSSLFSFSIPISAPHRRHFKIKSGQRPIDGSINCTFVFIPASMIRPPHFGHRTGRIRCFISCFHSSFFMHIPYTSLSCLFPSDGRGV